MTQTLSDRRRMVLWGSLCHAAATAATAAAAALIAVACSTLAASACRGTGRPLLGAFDLHTETTQMLQRQIQNPQTHTLTLSEHTHSAFFSCSVCLISVRLSDCSSSSNATCCLQTSQNPTTQLSLCQRNFLLLPDPLALKKHVCVSPSCHMISQSVCAE